MHTTLRHAAIAFAALASFAATAPSAEAGQSIQTKGVTSQPIGHYEFCQRYEDRCKPQESTGPLHLTPAALDKIEEVNEAVNVTIFPREDMAMHGKADVWSYPVEEGDCEDYVLLKQYMLERAGIPASTLLITVVRQSNGEGHAVLSVRTDRGDLILDNLSDDVKPWTATDYVYLKRQAENHAGRWVDIEDDRELLVGSIR